MSENSSDRIKSLSIRPIGTESYGGFVKESHTIEIPYANRVNCGKAETLIRSQATVGNVSVEGSETTRVSPNNNPLHERPTSLWDDDIVRPCKNMNCMMDRIKNLSDNSAKITIDTIPTITVRKYTKGMKLGNWQNVDSGKVDMYVNRSTVFEFSMNKIDLAQFINKDKMNQCAKDAAEQQRIYIDTEALSELYAYANADNIGTTAGRKSGFYNIGATLSPIALNESNILRYILMCQAVGDEQNWPTSDRWMVLPTWATFLLNNSDIKDASMTGEGTSLLINGHRVGKIGNFMVYQSNLYTGLTDGADTTYPILFGHRSAISFASQLVDVEYFDKLENDIGRAMRGFQLYDWKVTKDTSLGYLYAKMA